MRRSTHGARVSGGRPPDASWRPRDDGFGSKRRRGWARDPRVVAFLPEPLAPSRAARDRGRASQLARSRARNSPRTREQFVAERAAASAARFTERHIPPVAPRARPHASRDRATLARAHSDGREPARGTPAPGPHASAGRASRCAPDADRRHPRAKSLSRLACHTVCGARVEAPAPTPARGRRQTGGNHAHRADIIFLRSAWRAKNESRSPSLVLESFSESCDDYLLLLMRRIFPSGSFSRGATETSRKKSLDFLLLARPAHARPRRGGVRAGGEAM